MPTRDGGVDRRRIVTGLGLSQAVGAARTLAMLRAHRTVLLVQPEDLDVGHIASGRARGASKA
ncbi:MAG: hypothetical protein IPL39_14675 [Opitutaceae bacterium]|nr:hypothetical protein [Opitutaceae bacterium]